jgi:V/A-type H+-transporting ATPase subunit D
MPRLQLSKAELNRQGKQLKTFEQFLPSLDLKRRQLLAERGKALQAVRGTDGELQALEAAIEAELPMLANTNIDLTDIVKVRGCELLDDNVVGTRVPRLASVDIQVRPYGLLAKPHWVDRLVEYLKQALALRVRRQVEQRRAELLARAVRVVTQRVNLFDKVLIPTTRKNIKRIQIYLSDRQRAAVVNAKIAKRKHARETCG